MRSAGAAIVCAALLLCASRLHAQGWTADVYAGGHRYGPSAAALRSTSLIAALRTGSPADFWLYAMAAAPLEGDAPSWAAAGLARRSMPLPVSTFARVGAFASADAYVYRDPVADRTGQGVTLEAGPVAEAWFSGMRSELRASWRHHLASDGTDEISRGAPEIGARLERRGAVSAGATARVLRVSEGTYGMAGLDVGIDLGPIGVAAAAERWTGPDMQDVGWSVYASMPIRGVELWTGLRHDARDPLYWNPARRTWNAGVSIRLGRVRDVEPRTVLRQDGALMRVARSAAEGRIHIAGDFTGWQPQPMTESGGWWEYTIRLEPGVYHYAYVDESGRWFVPEETPGRIDDGMGGHVAVLVVP